jgi:hypothetical protein
MRLCKPPAPVAVSATDRVLFLAGSIDQGQAEDWQTAISAALGDLDVVVLNPRRDTWDASWLQSIENPEFRDQVTWELDGLERADRIALWLAPDSHAPITLLELGLHARGGKLVVGCPPGFWRRGNVEVICARFQIPLLASWDEFIVAVRADL